MRLHVSGVATGWMPVDVSSQSTFVVKYWMSLLTALTKLCFPNPDSCKKS